MAFFICQLIRYDRTCSSYECFILRAKRLSSKLLKQGCLMENLKSSVRTFYGRYEDLIQQYEVSLSRKLHNILTLINSDCHQTFHQFHAHVTELDLHRITSGMEHLKPGGYASREPLQFRTPCSVPFFGDLLVFQLLRLAF